MLTLKQNHYHTEHCRSFEETPNNNKGDSIIQNTIEQHERSENGIKQIKYFEINDESESVEISQNINENTIVSSDDVKKPIPEYINENPIVSSIDEIKTISETQTQSHEKRNDIKDENTKQIKKNIPTAIEKKKNQIFTFKQTLEVNSSVEGIIEKKKSKLKVILIIGGVIISIIIIGIVIYFLLKKDGDGHCKGKCDEDEEEEEFKTGSGENIVVKIDRKINQMWEYQGNEFTSTTNVLEDSSSLRRNEQINKTTKINYLLNVYDNETLSDNSILFSAFAVILRKITFNNDEEIYEGGVNLLEYDYTQKEENLIINEENENEINNEEIIYDDDYYHNDYPVIKFKFYENGTLYEIQKPQNISNKFFIHLKLFVNKVIPSVSEKLYSPNENDRIRRLQEEGVSNKYIKKDDKVILNEIRDHEISVNDINLEGSQVKSNREIEVDSQGNIQSIQTNQITSMSSEGNIDDECEDSICIEDKKDNIIQFPIRSIYSETSSNIILIQTNINETLSQNIKDLIQDLNFENYDLKLSVINGRRRLNEEKNKENYSYKKGKIFRKLVIRSFDQPMGFTLPFFKLNMNGILIKMNSKISYFPGNGTVIMLLYYKIGNEGNDKNLVYEKISLPFGKTYEKYNEVIDEISGGLYYIYNYLINRLYNNTWKKSIQKELTDISNLITNLYDASDIFFLPLNNLLNEIKNASKNAFNSIFLEIEKTISNLNSLNNEINSSNEENQKELIKESQIIINSAIVEYKELFDSFDSSTILLTETIIESLPELNQIDIGSYYDIKEQLSVSEKVYNAFEIMVDNALNTQNSLLTDYTNLLIKDNLEDIIKQEEFIAKRLQTNTTLIEAINDNEKRNNMIDLLNNIRIKVNDISKNIIKSIENISKNLRSGEEGELKTILADVENKKNVYLENKNQIETSLRNYIQVSDNFELYIEDTEILFQIDQNVTNERNKQFFEQIIIPLNALQTNFFTQETFNNIENLINEIINELNTNKDNNFSNIPNLLETLNTTIDDSISYYLDDNLIKNTYNLLLDSNYISNLFELYYAPVTDVFNKYLTVFRDEYFQNHILQYLDKPYEIQTKVNQILNKQKNATRKMINDMTYQLKESINEKLNTHYNIYKIKIQQYLFEIQKNTPKDNYNNIANTNINLVNTNFENIMIQLDNKKTESNKYENQKVIMNITNDTDPFQLNDKIKTHENAMLSLINRVSGLVQSDFDSVFCEFDNEGNCIYTEKLDASQQKLFQTAKLRYTISKISEIISLSKNTDSFNLLSYENYVNLFKSKADYENFISNEILNRLKELNNEEEKLIEPIINSIENNLTTTFENIINEGLIESKINILSGKIFTLPEKLNNKVENMKSSITNIFNEFKKNYINKSIYFEPISFQKSYDIFENSINEIISKNIETINKLKIDENLINQVKSYYTSILINIGNKFETEITQYTQILQDSNLLGLSYNIGKIGKEIKENTINKLKQSIEDNITTIFTNSFNEQINEIKLYLTQQNEGILDQLKTEYEIIFNDFSLKGELEYDKNNTTLINSLSNKLIESINSEAKNYYNGTIQDYNQSFINSYNLENKEKNLNILEINTIEFNDLQEKVLKGDELLKTFCKERIEKEKILFKETIENTIVYGYNKTIQDFSNSFGKNYLNSILNQITTNKIQSNLDNIESTIQNNHEFLLTILNDMSSCYETIGKSLKTVYKTLSTEISSNLDDDINISLENSINNFKLYSNIQITDLFLEHILIILKNDNFTKLFNQNIINLFPKEFTEAFKIQLKNNYNELLDDYNLDSFKILATNQIETSKNKIVESLNEFQKETEDQLVTMTSITISRDVKNVMNIVNKYKSNNYDIFPNSFNFSISENSKNILLSFIQKIKNIINPIIIVYEGNDEEIKRQLEEKLNSFDNYFEVVKSNLNSSDITTKTENSLNNLKNVKNNMKVEILKEIDGIDNDLKEIDLNVYRRNLEEFSITDIINDLDKIKKKFDSIQEELINLNEFIKISKDYSNFESLIKNMIEHISAPIESNLQNLMDYLSESQYSQFETNIKSQAENIKNYLSDFYNIENKNIYESINIIKSISSFYNSFHNEIKAKTDNFLSTYFEQIFSKIEPYENISGLIREKEGLELGNITTDILGEKITFNSNISEYSYDYSISFKYNNFTIYTNSSISAESYINLNYETENTKAGINGVIGSGYLSMNSNNLLKEYLTDLTKEQQTNPTNYKKSFSKKIKVGNEWRHINGGECGYDSYAYRRRYCQIKEIFKWETKDTYEYTEKSRKEGKKRF